MASDGEVTARIITCVVGLVAIVAVSWIGFCNYNSVGQSEVMLQLAQERGLHPVVVDCMMNRNWNIVSDFEMCRKIFEKANLTMEQAEDIKNSFND